MENDVKLIKQRVHRYWFVDGLAELSAGAFCLFLSFTFYIWSVVLESQLGNLTFYLVIFIGGIIGRWVLNKIKCHAIYPSTGFVDYRSGWTNKRAFAISFGFTLVLAALIFFSRTLASNYSWMPALGGLILTFIFVMVGYQTGWVKFYLLGIFCLFAGFLISISGWGDKLGVAVLSAILGVVLFASGFLTRKKYFRQELRHTLNNSEKMD